MKCPVSDLGFAIHPVHGRVAQLFDIIRVSELCSGKRRTAIDVGAHIGIWSTELSKRFEIVHAFEPVRENFDCLLENVARLPVIVHPGVALGAYKGQCSMALPSNGNSGMWGVSTATGSTVVHTLDSYQFSDVDLIKIDVEGYEGCVVVGAKETIKAALPVIVFEDNGLGVKRYGAEWIDPKQVLTELGYKKRLRIKKDEVWTPSR